jgi:hypothetical protein
VTQFLVTKQLMCPQSLVSYQLMQVRVARMFVPPNASARRVLAPQTYSSTQWHIVLPGTCLLNGACGHKKGV